MRKIFVAVPFPLSGPLTYKVPDDWEQDPKPGEVVEVPFRKKTCLGLVVPKTTSGGGMTENEEEDQKFKILEIKKRIFPFSVYTEIHLQWFATLAAYYLVSIGEIFATAFPSGLAKMPVKKNKTKKVSQEESSSRESSLSQRWELTFEQKNAVSQICDALDQSLFQPFLLFGVTGSGKTEVYLEATQRALDQKKQILILVPEISLTPQLRMRFESRFGQNVAILHSSLSPKLRREHWLGVHNQEKQIVLGARSALFAPLQNIGLIIIDEEHEPSYKQEDHFRYHARDAALLLAKKMNCPIVLGSATPSVETFYKAQQKSYQLLTLSSRPLNRSLPEIKLVDMKKRDAILSSELLNELSQTLDQHSQGLLFLNRKGFSSILTCKDCGYASPCSNCSVHLTYYKSRHELKCHLCGHQERAPDICPVCFSVQIGAFFNFGTEMIEEEVRRYFPHARVLRIDADSTKTTAVLEERLQLVRDRKVDFLIGTQMLAKGHDFPGMTCVGVIHSDHLLQLPDFRSGERTFQLLSQVAGRSGRGHQSGIVYLQTMMPDHPILQTILSHDYKAFYEYEIQFRSNFDYPPFSKLAMVEFRDMNESRAKAQAEKWTQWIQDQKIPGLTILGPSAAPILRVQGVFRWRFLLKSTRSSDLNRICRTLKANKVRFIDIDPISTL